MSIAGRLNVVFGSDGIRSGVSPEEIAAIARAQIGIAWSELNCTGFVWAVSNLAGAPFMDTNNDNVANGNPLTPVPVVIDGDPQYVIPTPSLDDVTGDGWTSKHTWTGTEATYQTMFDKLKLGDVVRIVDGSRVHSFIVSQVDPVTKKATHVVDNSGEVISEQRIESPGHSIQERSITAIENSFFSGGSADFLNISRVDEVPPDGTIKGDAEGNWSHPDADLEADYADFLAIQGNSSVNGGAVSAAGAGYEELVASVLNISSLLGVTANSTAAVNITETTNGLELDLQGFSAADNSGRTEAEAEEVLAEIVRVAVQPTDTATTTPAEIGGAVATTTDDARLEQIRTMLADVQARIEDLQDASGTPAVEEGQSVTVELPNTVRRFKKKADGEFETVGHEDAAVQVFMHDVTLENGRGVWEGADLAMTYVLENLTGNTQSGASVEFYVDTNDNGIWDSGDELAGTESAGTLQVDERDTESITLHSLTNATSTLATGEHTLFSVAKAQLLPQAGVLLDIRTFNLLDPDLLDFDLDGMTNGNGVSAYDPLGIDFSMEVKDGSVHQNSRVELWAGQGASWDQQNDVHLQTVNFGTLNPFEEKDANIDLMTASDLYEGGWDLNIVFFSHLYQDGIQIEFPLEFTVDNPLTLTSLSLENEGSVAAGSDLLVDYGVQNAEDRNRNDLEVQFYLDNGDGVWINPDDGVGDPANQDVLLAADLVGLLHGEMDLSRTLVLPTATLGIGDHVVHIVQEDDDYSRGTAIGDFTVSITEPQPVPIDLLSMTVAERGDLDFAGSWEYAMTLGDPTHGKLFAGGVWGGGPGFIEATVANGGADLGGEFSWNGVYANFSTTGVNFVDGQDNEFVVRHDAEANTFEFLLDDVSLNQVTYTGDPLIDFSGFTVGARMRWWAGRNDGERDHLDGGVSAATFTDMDGFDFL